MEKHPGDHSNFSMEVMTFISMNMQRQTTESVKIQIMSMACELLNRRGEWGQNLPPKLSIEGSEEQTQQEVKKKRK